jgi:hypothetical protein
MPSFHAVCRFGLALAFVGLLAANAPAKADIEKLMRQCDGKLCAYFRASITIPEGWVEDPEASRELGVQLLLPKGQPFDTAPAKIYALVRYNKDKKPLSATARDTYRDWSERAKNAKVEKLADVARQNGKPAFERHQFESSKLPEQGYEITSLAPDSDKDGNDYVVVLCLSANTRESLKSAEAAYLSILKAY